MYFKDGGWEGKDGPNWDHAATIASHMRAHGLPYIVVGDFNCEPHVFDGAIGVNEMNAVLVHSGSITCRAAVDSEVQQGTNIDYVALSGNFPGHASR